MKKILMMIIIFALGFILVGGIILVIKNNSKEKEEINLPTKKELYDTFANWANTIIQEKTYDKCINDKLGCFISLKSLQKDYQYDISIFTSKSVHCNVDKTGIYLNLEGETPSIAHFALKDCNGYLLEK